MFWSLNRWYRSSLRILLVCLAIASCCGVAMSQAHSDAADLQGTVRDANGAAVANATITVRNTATNVSRETTTNDDGFYKIVNLPPGNYEITAKASNYKTAVLPSVKLTVGQTINQDVPLEVGELTATVTVTTVSPSIVETTNTNVATIIDRERIENLPINERNYLSFALTSSTVSRDAGRPIGPAPTTGLNFGGQRGRSNLVQVDGARPAQQVQAAAKKKARGNRDRDQGAHPPPPAAPGTPPTPHPTKQASWGPRARGRGGQRADCRQRDVSAPLERAHCRQLALICPLPAASRRLAVLPPGRWVVFGPGRCPLPRLCGPSHSGAAGGERRAPPATRGPPPGPEAACPPPRACRTSAATPPAAPAPT